MTRVPLATINQKTPTPKIMILLISSDRLVVFDNNIRRVLIKGNDMKTKTFNASPESVTNLVHHCFDAIAQDTQLMITTNTEGNIFFNNPEDINKLN